MTRLTEPYFNLLNKVKSAVLVSQQQAAMAVNSRMLFAYWQIGFYIRQESLQQGWGKKVVEQLAMDLSQAFPDMKGLSKRNLVYMQTFAGEWPEEVFTQQPAAQIQSADKQESITAQQPAALFRLFEQHPVSRIPWSHHMVLLDKLKTRDERLFYCWKIAENSWSRKVLLNQLERGLHKQQGALPHNFETTLPEKQADLVKATFKDPYFLDFMQLGEEADELEIEKKLVQQISSFLLELGAGFAYMGRQFKLEVGGKEFRLDLLFYHTKLKCYVNIELKIGEFKPEYAGKSQFYLTAINEQVKLKEDNPSIGIILCKEANRLVVEYALKESKVPLGVAEYKLVQEIPENMKGALPSVDQFQHSFTVNDNNDELS